MKKIIILLLLLICISFNSGAEGDYLDSFNTTDEMTAGENSGSQAITTDGTNIWITTYNAGTVYKYDMDGVYQSDSWTGEVYLFGMCSYGDYLYIPSDTGDDVGKYEKDGTDLGSLFSVSGEGAGGYPTGCATDGSYFWVSDRVQAEVFKYNYAGVYQSFSFDTAGSGNAAPGGLTTDGNYIWVVDYSDNEIYKYWVNGTYNSKWAVDGDMTQPRDITNDGVSFWVSDPFQSVVYRYEMVAADTCTCAGAGNDWEIDMSDYCNITDACDLTTGTLSFTGAGETKCDAVIETTNLGDPGVTGLLSILADCIIWII